MSILRVALCACSAPPVLFFTRVPACLTAPPSSSSRPGFGAAAKTRRPGDMIQTWILRQDVNPFAAIHSWPGRFRLRGLSTAGHPGQGAQTRTVNRGRACYVSMSSSAAWRCGGSIGAGHYVPFDRRRHLALFRGRMLRIGSYGDPCASPTRLGALVRIAAGRTGYTHQWRDRRFWPLSALLNGQCGKLGASTRRTGARLAHVPHGAEGTLPERGEFSCPASAESGHRLTCDRCGACNGANGRPGRASVVICGARWCQPSWPITGAPWGSETFSRGI